MGLFYKSFIQKTIETFKIQDQSFEVFLNSDQMKLILEEFDITEDSLTWALNLEQIFNQLDIEPQLYKDRIEKPLKDNYDDWNNSDLSFLKKNHSN